MNVAALSVDGALRAIHASQLGRPLRILATLLMLCVSWLALPSPAQAQTCWITGSPYIAFGAVGGGGASSSGTLNFICDNYTGGTVSHRVCLFMNPSNPAGVAPRRMINYNPLTYLNYDLYADPAHSQLLGSETSGNTVYSTVLTMAGNGQQTGSIQVYARIPAGQTVAAGNYESQIIPIIHYANQTGNTAPSPSQCAASSSVSQNYSTVTANFANTCYVSTATDMDFGSVANLSTTQDRTSAISLRCPANTAWQVALNSGSNPSGTTRRMLGPNSSHIAYELYKDPSRTQVWGNTTATDVEGIGNNATQTLTVYGRVPTQTVGSAGVYSDTVTITLTY